ncbi:hypothetical protein LX15_001709 [Streptoalloteichus tenebrarius]|uniref:Uncharacterized protein n=1 Tax=Streptoalloteichus tenebrarius (strain ATCC 17920 / DSM 40477 / JCM 4838 / CBS 697.72 / NBRC 16177 / NCIMB 11028 / NRRL B-12390 / A12253. 1 / ISP 5477) TaxID=1933 RepID=A0ABT1HRA4_STRSD|nr:hypothetical protein [Streptoalloteichus tenebrarius]BFF01690.1 hypothetical protein GCM10020241_33650 [Streptoalloteichus tenebrarius]
MIGVETWRIVATCLLTLGGLVLVLVAMAQARDRKGSTRGDVARSALISLGVLAVADALAATVLPSTITWGIVAAEWILIGVVTLAD